MQKRVYRAFSVIELLITFFIFMLTAVAAVSVVFKKSKTPKKVLQEANSYFLCNKDANDSVHGKYIDKGCELYLTSESAQKAGMEFYPDIIQKEFVHIKLIGGGAAGSETTGGGAGEEKLVIYPSLIQPLGCEVGEPAIGMPVCQTCTAENKCTKVGCPKGYKDVDGVCEINFKYRVVLGSGGKYNAGKYENGNPTELRVVSLDNDKVLATLETAVGGKVSNEFCENDDCKKGELSSRKSQAGSGGDAKEQGKRGEVEITW